MDLFPGSSYITHVARSGDREQHPVRRNLQSGRQVEASEDPICGRQPAVEIDAAFFQPFVEGSSGQIKEGEPSSNVRDAAARVPLKGVVQIVEGPRPFGDVGGVVGRYENYSAHVEGPGKVTGLRFRIVGLLCARPSTSSSFHGPPSFDGLGARNKLSEAGEQRSGGSQTQTEAEKRTPDNLLNNIPKFSVAFAEG